MCLSQQCYKCHQWGCNGSCVGVQWLNPPWLTSFCEHCYCKDSATYSDHLQCCKCLGTMHRKFVLREGD